MNQIKFELVKLGLLASWLLAAVTAALTFFDLVVMEGKFLSLPLKILCIAGFFGFLVLSFIFTRLRNKYRDMVDYDENGISTKYGNFSSLSNQERAEIERQKTLKREMLIDSITLKNITHRGSDNPTLDIRKIIGLENVKDEIMKMAARMEFDKKLLKKKHFESESSSHMCFMGNPGTGKTSCVKIITGFLYEYKLIKKNQYVEVDGNFFNGTSYGESTEKVRYIINQAKGGVLFIDEAYALLNSVESQEVIATLVAAMENDRDKIVIILAGYTNQMKTLINSNAGLQSRIKYYFNFADYNMDELWKIFKMMACNNGFEVDDDVYYYFVSAMLAEMKKRNYGNARTVRNVLDNAISNHAYRYMQDKSIDKMRINRDDIPTGGIVIKEECYG